MPAIEAPATMTPRAVNELVRGALARHIPATLHVLGEIGDLSRPQSGHLYFSLKDAYSELRCVMWRSAAVRLKFTPELGMEVIATGGLEVYTPRGTYQLIVRKLEPRGVGALEVAFRQLRERLEREGLFDPERKKPLPKVPQRVAVVTSPSGAAIRDISQTLARRFPAVEILVFPVRVQGEGAAQEIAGAIRQMNRHAQLLGGIDVAIVGRGGGSLEDLWAFNEEVVARAIALGAIPIVSAVGHEVDVTISDLVADVRAATPTAAAELIAPRLVDLLEWLDRQAARVLRATGQAVDLARSRLEALLASDGLARPLARVRERGQLVDERQQRLRLVTAGRFRMARERLGHAEVSILRFGSGMRVAQLSQRLEQRVSRARRGVERVLLFHERRVNARVARLQRVVPSGRLERYDEHLHHARQRIAATLRQAVAHHRRLLKARVEAIAACDPKRVLRRGYSVTREARTRRVIRSIEEIRDRMRIVTELADGEFRSTADDPRQPRLFE
ncbi:MAG: exodeoxyribonuclease VII large subunit [Phycisphaerae bacterium]